MGYEQGTVTVHEFRSTASTMLNEQGNNRDWIERQLAHGDRDGVRAAYNYAVYLPQRRIMMQACANHLDTLRRLNPISDELSGTKCAAVP
jgi:integrase